MDWLNYEEINIRDFLNQNHNAFILKLNDREILNQNKWSASIHTDSPETKHVWESEVLEIFTFTISIKSPIELSGLRFWMDTESWNNVSPIYYQECSPDQQNLLEHI